MSVRKLNLALFTVALTGSLMIGTCLVTLAEAKRLTRRNGSGHRRFESREDSAGDVGRTNRRRHFGNNRR